MVSFVRLNFPEIVFVQISVNVSGTFGKIWSHISPLMMCLGLFFRMKLRNLQFQISNGAKPLSFVGA